MRVVLDTNVIASALLWGGTPERLIEFAGEGSLECFTSEALLSELAGILGRAKFAQKLRQKSLSASEIVARYREIAETVEAAPIEEAALRDADDAAVLSCAPHAPRRSYRATAICTPSVATMASRSYRLLSASGVSPPEPERSGQVGA